MKEQIEELRLEIDSLAGLINSLLPFKGVITPWRYVSKGAEGNNTSFELYEAEKSLLLAKAWCGKLLGELGGTTPYKKDGNRHSVSDIEPTDAKSPETNFTTANHVERVDGLRQLIQNIINKVPNEIPKDISTRESAICRTQIWIHLTEARLHLGFELGRIREAADGSK